MLVQSMCERTLQCFVSKIWWFCFKCSKSAKSKLPAICLLDNYLVLTIKTKQSCCAAIAVYQAVIKSQIILNLLLALLSAGLCTVCLFHRSEWVREEKYMNRLNREQKMATKWATSAHRWHILVAWLQFRQLSYYCQHIFLFHISYLQLTQIRVTGSLRRFLRCCRSKMPSHN